MISNRAKGFPPIPESSMSIPPGEPKGSAIAILRVTSEVVAQALLREGESPLKVLLEPTDWATHYVRATFDEDAFCRRLALAANERARS